MCLQPAGPQPQPTCMHIRPSFPRHAFNYTSTCYLTHPYIPFPDRVHSLNFDLKTWRRRSEGAFNSCLLHTGAQVFTWRWPSTISLYKLIEYFFPYRSVKDPLSGSSADHRATTMMHFKCDLLLFTNPYSQGYQSHLIVIHAHIHFFSISYASHMVLYLTLKGDLSTLSHNLIRRVPFRCDSWYDPAQCYQCDLTPFFLTHWPKLLARECDATNLIRRVPFRCDSWYDPAQCYQCDLTPFFLTHWPKLLARECDATNLIRRVFQCEQLFAPCEHPAFPKRGNSSNFR